MALVCRELLRCRAGWIQADATVKCPSGQRPGHLASHGVVVTRAAITVFFLLTRPTTRAILLL